MKKALAIMMAVLACIVLLPAGCGGGEESGPSIEDVNTENPVKVTEAFLAATVAGDAELAWELITELSRTTMKKDELVEGADEFIMDFEVGTAVTDESISRVEVTMTMKEQDEEHTITFDFVLVDEDGEWKVSMGDTHLEMQKAYQEMSGGPENGDTGQPGEEQEQPGEQ